MTVSDLIDYLNQFPGKTLVFLTEADAANNTTTNDFIILATLDFSENADDSDDE